MSRCQTPSHTLEQSCVQQLGSIGCGINYLDTTSTRNHVNHRTRQSFFVDRTPLLPLVISMFSCNCEFVQRGRGRNLLQQAERSLTFCRSSLVGMYLLLAGTGRSSISSYSRWVDPLASSSCTLKLLALPLFDTIVPHSFIHSFPSFIMLINFISPWSIHSSITSPNQKQNHEGRLHSFSFDCSQSCGFCLEGCQAKCKCQQLVPKRNLLFGSLPLDGYSSYS